MKYNTISTSSLSSEGRKSTLTLYTDSDFIKEKAPSETEIASIRGELEIVQRALKTQTRRCKQLVAEYTKRLQEKEQQYQSEKLLRDDQLAKVLRALLIFEARLKQEQKIISHQLSEKDYVIKKQRENIDRLSNQYCKHCNQFYSPVHNLESLDSSSEYVATDYQDYSNFESLDSSSETYATLSDIAKREEKTVFLKNKMKDGFAKRGRKLGHRKSVGTYFEVLKLRSDNPSPNQSSNEDNTSNDYESLPAESVSDKITAASERIEGIFAKCTDLTEDNLDRFNLEEVCDDNDNVVANNFNQSAENGANTESTKEVEQRLKVDENAESTEGNNESFSKINETIPIFEGDDETNDNWYASASDQEDDEQRDIYRNNPVLECMNQILLQNISDNINSPPKTPTVDRRQIKNNKRVKFSDEENLVLKENLANSETAENGSNYYEIPIQKMPNFYETPQSIYSNDYEQILTKSPTGVKASPTKKLDGKESYYYVDMDTKSEIENEQASVVRKTKIVRTPPALPPKPANLLSRYKINNQNQASKIKTPSVDSDPDYCSISELNLPTHKIISSKKLNVVAEINIPNSQDVKIAEKHVILHSPKQKDISETNLIIPKTVEKISIQIAKHMPIKSSSSPNNDSIKNSSSSSNAAAISENMKEIIKSPANMDILSNVELLKASSVEMKKLPSSTNAETVKPLALPSSLEMKKSSSITNAEIIKPSAFSSSVEPKKLATSTNVDILKPLALSSSVEMKKSPSSTNAEILKSMALSSSVEMKKSPSSTNAEILKSMALSSSVEMKKSPSSTNAEIFKSMALSSKIEMKKSPSSANTEILKSSSTESKKSPSLTNVEIIKPSAFSSSNEMKKSPSLTNTDIIKPLALSSNIEMKKSPSLTNVEIIKPLGLDISKSPISSNAEIPKLPLVSEIIIPEENELVKKEDHISHDNYIKNNSQMLKIKPNNRRSILIGSSVSSLINTFNNQQLFSEMGKYKHKKPFVNFDQAQNSDKRTDSRPINSERQNFDKFDLSQNFEEFKLDDCEIEEYNSETVDLNETRIIEEFPKEEHVLPDILPSPKKTSTHVEIVRATNDLTIPQLNPSTIQQLKKKLELDKNYGYKEPEPPLTQKTLNEPSYEHFLECTGLSSKSILTPSRLLSNHKSMLKPKDVKLRSKVKSSVLDSKQTSTIKYWSEPYI